MEELSDATGVMEVDRTYSYGLDLIAQDRFDVGSSAWDATFYLYDGHGNVRALADDAGTITDTYDYDAFGTLIEQLVLDVSSGVPVTTDNRDLITENNYLYCGEQFDADLGLYFLRARYMDTDRGRFWSMDTFEGVHHDPTSLHKYLYVHANPVNWLDPSGKFKLTEIQIAQLIGMLISGAVGGSSGVIATYLVLGEDANLSDYLIAFLVGGISGAVALKAPASASFGAAFFSTYFGAMKSGCDQIHSVGMGIAAGFLALAVTVPANHLLGVIFENIGWAPYWEFLGGPLLSGASAGVVTGAAAELGGMFCGDKKVRSDWIEVLTK